MKKKAIMKKGAAFTLAAIMACTAYAPAAVFATEVPEDQVAAAQAEPVAEQQVEPTTENKAPAQQAESKEAPAVQTESEQTTEEQTPAVEESQYGEATGAWGYGNDTQTTRWDEYTKDGETILVFKTTGDSESDADNAVTQLLDENGKSAKDALKSRVTQIVFETGITGIGWTALYDKSFYEPVYGSEYEVDKSKTDLFNGFTKLTVVTPCETIKRIGWSAFRKCSNLNSFDFSKCTGLEEIMNQAFSECKSLNNVDLSDCNALTTIAWGAFHNAGKGKDASLTLPAEGVLAVIGGKAFLNFAANSSNGEVDFTPVACSVTKILQYAFSGTKITGEIIGFKNLDTIGNGALGNYITYVPYDPSQDEPVAEEPVVEEPAVEEPVVEEPVVEEPVVEDEMTQAEEVKAMPIVEEVVAPAIEDIVAPIVEEVAAPIMPAAEALAIQNEEVVESNGVVTAAAARNTNVSAKTANASASTMDPTEINDNEVAMAAAADEAQSDSFLGFILGGLAAALLLVVFGIKLNDMNAKRNTLSE